MQSIPGKNNLTKIFNIILSLLICTILLILIFNCHYETKAYDEMIVEASTEFFVEASLIKAVIKAEGNFNKRAISEKGASGLMQILPKTFVYVKALYGLNYLPDDIFDPKTNIFVGTAYLNYLFNKFKTEREVVAAYNAGEGNVLTWLTSNEYSLDGKTLNYIPFAETTRYVEKVLLYKKHYEDKI